MGILGQTRSRESAEKACREVMYPHEVVAIYEIAPLLGTTRRTVELLATGQALYVRGRSGRPKRIPYEGMWSIDWEGFTPNGGGLFQITLNDGARIGVTLKRPNSSLPELVRERIEALVVLDRHVDRDGVDGDGARLRYRRLSELGSYGWTALPDRQGANAEPEWDEWVREQMRALEIEAETAASAQKSELGLPPLYHADWGDGLGATFVWDGASAFVCYVDDPDAPVDTTRFESLLAIAWDELAYAHGQPAAFVDEEGDTAVSITWKPALPSRST